MTEFSEAVKQIKEGKKVTCYACDTSLEKHLLALINKEYDKLPSPKNNTEELLQLLVISQAVNIPGVVRYDAIINDLLYVYAQNTYRIRDLTEEEKVFFGQFVNNASLNAIYAKADSGDAFIYKYTAVNTGDSLHITFKTQICELLFQVWVDLIKNTIYIHQSNLDNIP